MLPALAVQLAAVLLEPATVAMNCVVAPAITVAAAGATLTVTGAAAVMLKFTGLLVVPPSPLLITVMGTLVPTWAAWRRPWLGGRWRRPESCSKGCFRIEPPS